MLDVCRCFDSSAMRLTGFGKASPREAYAFGIGSKEKATFASSHPGADALWSFRERRWAVSLLLDLRTWSATLKVPEPSTRGSWSAYLQMT